MPLTDRKRRTRAHVIADLSVNHVEKCVLLCGWTVQRFSPDYGLDLLMTTFSRRGEIENGDVRMQIKATDSLRIVSGGRMIAVRVQWRDMTYWLNHPLPVMLVIYDAHRDRAWWMHLNDGLRKEGRKLKIGGSTTLRVPLTNILDPQAVRYFRDLRNLALACDRSGDDEND
jgi:hypothetical protein